MGLRDILRFGKKRDVVEEVAKKTTPTLFSTSSVYEPRASYSGRNYNAYAIGYTENVYLYRATDYFATAVSGIKLKLYESKDKKKEIQTHPFMDMLANPHTGGSQVELTKSFASFSVLSGNGYLYAVRGGNKPRNLWALRPDTVDVTQYSNGTVEYTLNNGADREVLDPKYLLHLKMFNPTDSLLGLSPVAVAASLIDTMNAGNTWNLALLQNSGRPSGALITQATLSDNSYLSLKQQIEEMYTGSSNAGRPWLLDGGLDWKQFSLAPTELDWLASKESIAKDIALAIGVPPILLDKGEATYNNYKEARSSFYVETVLPYLDLLISKLNAWLKVLYPGESLYIDYDREDIEALQEDRAQVIDRVNKQYTAGYLTANEARKATGLDIIKGFDFIVTPDNKLVQAKDIEEFTKLPEGEAGNGTNNTTSATSTGGGATAKPVPDSAVPSTSEEDRQRIRQQERESAQQQQPQKQVKALNLNPEQKTAYWHSVENKRERWYTSVEEDFTEYFKQEEERVLKALSKAALPDTVYLHTDKVLDDTTALTKLYAKTYMNIGNDFGTDSYNAITSGVRTSKQVKAVNEEPDVNVPQSEQGFDVWASIVIDWLKNYSSTKIAQVTENTKQQVRDKLAEGVKRGESIYQLADRIRGLYAEYYKNRSVAIARTEVISASNLGAMAGAIQTGLTLKKEWISTRDSRTRESHVKADGQIVGRDEAFKLGDDKLDYPGDTSQGAAPENTIQCRCTVAFIYVEDEEKKPDTQKAILDAVERARKKIR